jgi:hypothetical protein
VYKLSSNHSNASKDYCVSSESFKNNSKTRNSEPEKFNSCYSPPDYQNRKFTEREISIYENNNENFDNIFLTIQMNLEKVSQITIILITQSVI